tara:strand:- start:508 stop:1173 length:666 start_codon:yes stop_codon:yes gene_type:complete
MVDIINSILQGFVNFFQSLVNSVPEQYRILVSLLLYTIFIVIYAVFIWKFYRFMAEREIIKLNLSQYNYSSRPGLDKFLSIVLSTIEYVIILPFLVFFWFSVFSIFLLVLSSSQEPEMILLIAAAIIASTRITSYISQNLSRDLAKIFPFTVLALFLLDPAKFFDINVIFDKIIQIPSLFGNILMFLIFIFSIELILRLVYSISAFIYSRKGEVEVKVKSK